MKNNCAHLIYFSPTGTTRKITCAIAEGLATERLDHHGLTYALASTGREITYIVDGVAVIGVPVYAGRVPVTCLERLASYRAEGVPAVLAALYGNREFEDALVELRDVAIAQGFNVIAAGAFIGEHSYSTPNRPIAVGRPDVDDLKVAVGFGRQVAAKIVLGDLGTPEIAGNVPYRERVKFGGIAPGTDAETCTLCGRCARVCPVRLISVSASVTTRADHCIMCCACVKICPVEARLFDHPGIEEKREMLARHCSIPKTPKLFL